MRKLLKSQYMFERRFRFERAFWMNSCCIGLGTIFFSLWIIYPRCRMVAQKDSYSQYFITTWAPIPSSKRFDHKVDCRNSTFGEPHARVSIAHALVDHDIEEVLNAGDEDGAWVGLWFAAQ